MPTQHTNDTKVSKDCNQKKSLKYRLDKLESIERIRKNKLRINEADEGTIAYYLKFLDAFNYKGVLQGGVK